MQQLSIQVEIVGTPTRVTDAPAGVEYKVRARIPEDGWAGTLCCRLTERGPMFKGDVPDDLDLARLVMAETLRHIGA